MGTLIGYLQHALHLPGSLGARAQAHGWAPDAGIRNAEIGMVECVEHLDSDLSAECLFDTEPFSEGQIFIDIFGSSEIGEVARNAAECERIRLLECSRVEEAVLRTHLDERIFRGTRAALTGLKAGPGQVRVLVSTKNSHVACAGADRHRETALGGGDPRYLPAAGDCIRNRVHAAAEPLTPAKRQIVHVI